MSSLVILRTVCVQLHSFLSSVFLIHRLPCTPTCALTPTPTPTQTPVEIDRRDSRSYSSVSTSEPTGCPSSSDLRFGLCVLQFDNALQVRKTWCPKLISQESRKVFVLCKSSVNPLHPGSSNFNPLPRMSRTRHTHQETAEQETGAHTKLRIRIWRASNTGTPWNCAGEANDNVQASTASKTRSIHAQTILTPCCPCIHSQEHPAFRISHAWFPGCFRNQPFWVFGHCLPTHPSE